MVETRAIKGTTHKEFMAMVAAKRPGFQKFHQAVSEVMGSLMAHFAVNPRMADQVARHNILARLVEPERAIIFSVPWVDDKGEVRVNTGYRIEFNSAIGPYKGGLRLHPTVDLDTLMFLGFEQVLKNSLTTLPMGGGKGGSDFDPKGKSDFEVMRFCQSFMTGLFRHIGPNTDVPAGDIGVGRREIGYMLGEYKRLTNEHSGGVLTGKGLEWNGSLVRPEATGYGLVYFTKDMLESKNDTLKGKKVAISGSGNAAQFAAEKAMEEEAIVVTLSDSSGYVFDPHGLNGRKFAFLKELKNVRRGRISEYAQEFAADGVKFHKGIRPWYVEDVDVALPCATENELSEKDAKALVENGVICVAEGANMPSEPGAIEVFQKAKILYGPGKAANAGGVAVSGLEMSQNSLRLQWTAKEVDERLRGIMHEIHKTCRRFGQIGDWTDYVRGANVGGFVKVATAMMEMGV